MGYECDRCGACCKQLIIEIDHVDVVREPRLLEVATLLDGNGLIKFENDWEKVYGLNRGTSLRCPMLDEDNLCGCYSTRPNVCVMFEAGSDQCQDARESAKLLPLELVSDGGELYRLLCATTRPNN